MSNKPTYHPEKDFQRYLNNQMSNSERNAFERYLQKNAFESEAMEGFSGHDPSVIMNDLNDLNKKIHQKKRNKMLWIRVAAVALILISSGIIFYRIDTHEVQKQMVENREEEKITPQDKKEEVLPEEQATLEQKQDDIPKNINTESKEKPQQIIEPKSDNVSAKPASTFQQTEKAGHSEGKTESALKNEAKVQEPITQSIDIVNEPRSEEILMQIEDETDELEPKLLMKTGTLKGITQNVSVSNNPDSTPQIRIRGTVVSKNLNEAIPGVNIVAKGTTIGTITDLNGNFELQVPDENIDTFVASFVGMENKEFEHKEGLENVIQLEESELGLSEVVVVGYGEQRKRDLTGNSMMISENSTPPLPLGGYKNYHEYLKENCLVDELQKKQKNVVRVKLFIDQKGAVTNIVPLNNPDSILLKKAKEIISEGPGWSPELKNGKPIDSDVILKLKFKSSEKR